MKHISTGIDKVLKKLIGAKKDVRTRLAAEQSVDRMMEALNALDDVIQMQLGVCLPQNQERARKILFSLYESRKSEALRRQGELPVDQWDFAEPQWLAQLSDDEVKQRVVIRNAMIKAVRDNHQGKVA